ncbi:hypothetical protein [Sporosarcina sp. SAFN-010]|uniref:hypothetical protein n=1 Tax=Sporosarcina sp. SAFN-010 TaxID=3387273 RepID=UPI003F7F9FD2
MPINSSILPILCAMFPIQAWIVPILHDTLPISALVLAIPPSIWLILQIKGG